MTTRNLANTILWASAFLRNQPQDVTNMQPALDSANVVMQTILGEPFKWRWNRASLTIAATNAGGQDYTVAAPNFGFVERLEANDTASGDIIEMIYREVMTKDPAVDAPRFLSAQGDDNQGNLTFRVTPRPAVGQDTTVTVIYQQKPPVLTSLASLWAPLPDEFQYIYDIGFLTWMMVLSNDGRMPIFRDMFLSHLLGKAQGLTETERNIFLGNWLQVTSAAQASQMQTQMGVAGRGK